MTKNCLIGFIIAIALIIPISNASALETTNGSFPDIPDGFDNFVITTKSDGSIRMFAWNSSDKVYVVSSPTGTPSLYFTTSLSYNYNSSQYLQHNYVSCYDYVNGNWKFNEKTSGSTYRYYNLIATTVDVYIGTTNYTAPSEIKYLAGYGLAPEIVNELKKEFTYNDKNNPLKYVDLYFDTADFGNKINFEFNLIDNNYGICSDCEYADIFGFDISYLIKDENNLYHWEKINSADTKIGIDYDGSLFPSNETGEGVTLTGTINLDFDTTVYSFEKIRISFKLSNANNITYKYSDTSSISENDIDEYYHYMMGNAETRYNKISNNNSKYVIITTPLEEVNSSLLIEYINTNKYLYVEYFDTLYKTYLSDGMIYSFEHFLINKRDFEKYNFTIGKSNNRGLYLMNYLHQKDGENAIASYNFYFAEDLYFSYTDYLSDANYIDKEENVNTGITSNPDYETDNTQFSDYLKELETYLNELKATSDFFNNSWNKLYGSMPGLVRSFIIFATHMICMLVVLKLVGWGD